MKYKAKSSSASLVANGLGEHILNPWTIIVDSHEETITISKKNWFLIGRDSDVISFRFIRKVTIDEHLIGADIHIKVIGGTATAFCIPKSIAKKIKKLLLDYNAAKRGKGIIFS
jgi:hypothetical protein